MHITKKATLSIVACLLVIIAAYVYYQRLHYEKITNTPPLVTPHRASNITGYSWTWKYTTRIDGTKKDAPTETFVLSLNDKTMTVTSTTDCNTLSSTYSKNNEVLSFAPFISTKMFCENSEEATYAKELALTNSYTIVGNKLYLALHRDFGTMVFEKNEKNSTSTTTSN